MKNASYLGIAVLVGLMRKTMSDELELPGDLTLDIKASPFKTVVTVSFKHARKGTKVGGSFELSELHRQMMAGEVDEDLVSIVDQIKQAIPEIKNTQEL